MPLARAQHHRDKTLNFDLQGETKHLIIECDSMHSMYIHTLHMPNDVNCKIVAGIPYTYVFM